MTEPIEEGPPHLRRVVPGSPDEALPDYTLARSKRIAFVLDGEVYECWPATPLLEQFDALPLIGTAFGDDHQISKQQRRDACQELLGMLLQPAEQARLLHRLSSRSEPVDAEQLSRVVTGVLEQYGMRPTPPSEPSSDGSVSQESGTRSAASAPSAGSIS